jgi:alpha-L-rhamnosidase
MTVKSQVFASAAAAAALFVWPSVGTPQNQQPAGDLVDLGIFKAPPAEYRGQQMYGYGMFNLSTLSEDRIIAAIQNMAKQNMGGFAPEPGGGPTTGLPEDYLKATRRTPSSQGVVYLSEEYFKLYRVALEEARKRGMNVILYDEWTYPTGIVDGQLYAKYPQHVAKSLELAEKNVTGPAKAELAIPGDLYVGAVMMNRDTFELVDISSRRAPGKPLVAQVPKGNWKVMAFYLDASIRPASQKGAFVDYLDETAMDAFISLSYQKMYDHLGEFFGKEIRFTFWDEPAMHPVDGRMWTPSFNKNFEKKYGFSPMKYYPALWYDIGPQTAAARNALFGFRAHLFATNFVKKLEDFCEAHGIKAGGHFDQEEPVSPVGVNGDLMKLFEHQGVPAVDDIYFLGRSNPGYKIVASAAFNYDKPVFFAETYAAYGGLSEKTVYKVAMDQYAMGVNLQVTSGGPALWNSAYMPQFNNYLGRMSYLLQHGRHVADVAVLYPIAALETAYRFDGGQHTSPAPQPAPRINGEVSAREGGIVPPEIDYQNIGDALFRGVRVDYTYLHPEVLAGRCAVEGKKLILNNRENREEYSVLIVPGGDTLSVAAAAKIREFYDKGGVVIATTRLPTKSAEFGRDKEIQKMVADVFGLPVDDPPTADLQRASSGRLVTFYFSKRNAAGGQSYFLPQPEAWVVQWALGRVLPVRDVNIQAPMPLLKKGPDYDGALTYIHKVKDGRDIYFFANSTDKVVDTKVILRGKKSLNIWNPYTGEAQQAEFTSGEAGGQPVTTIHLVLPAVSSLFYVGE